VHVIRSLQAATHSAVQARSLHGVRPGITLPIVLGGSAVGTVGITGSPAQVRRFGMVVKRQTEILLQESVLVRSRMLRARAIDDLVRDIAHFDADIVDPELIAYRATELGYDLTLPRTVIVVNVAAAADADRQASMVQPELSDSESTLRLALLRTMRATFPSPVDIVAAMPSDRFVVFHRGTVSRSGNGHDDDLPARCRTVIDQISRRHGLRATVGIGDTGTTVAELHAAYEDASEAQRLGSRLPGWPSVNTIGDIRIHQLLAGLGQRTRTRFVEVVAARLREHKDWPILRQTTIAWCESGFNLVHAAAALHIHRNTLVYRLDKIAQLTGSPVRDHRAALALYLACLTDQLDGIH
jgi:carbohydrate diacid regulator